MKRQWHQRKKTTTKNILIHWYIVYFVSYQDYQKDRNERVIYILIKDQIILTWLAFKFIYHDQSSSSYIWIFEYDDKHIALLKPK